MSALIAAAMLAAVVAASAIDIARFEIPDEISIFIVAIAVLRGVLDPGFVWWSHLAAPAAMFAFGLLAFSRGWLGGGDVKLMVVLAAWTGLAGLPIFFLATSIGGGVLAVSLASLRYAVRRTTAPRWLRQGQPLPYAVAIALGTLWWAWVTRGELLRFYSVAMR